MTLQHFGALAGLKIIDLTQMLAGPFCTMLLADQGATVIKVEPPAGDMVRSLGSFREEDTDRQLNGYFQSINRNKESVVLDLKSEAGRSALRRLIQDADVVVENFRAGVMDRLGLSYEALRAVNPRLVYGALRGFGDGRTGASPLLDWPAFDVVAQAMGGMIAITGPDGDSPTKVGPGIGDTAAGMFLAFGIVSAVLHARATGEGQFVDVAMADAILALCERPVWQHSVLSLTPGPEGNHHPFLAPFGVFPAADGYVTIAAHSDAFFRIFCEATESISLLSDPRFVEQKGREANRAELRPLVAAITARFSKEEMTAMFGGQIPFAPVMNVQDILASPHFAARDMIAEVEQPGMVPLQIVGTPLKMTGTPGGVHRRSPFLGEQTRTWLRAAGLTDEEIALVSTHRGQHGAREVAAL